MNSLFRCLFFVGASFCAIQGIVGAAEFRALSWSDSISDLSYTGQSKNAAPLRITSNSLTGWHTFTPGDAVIEFRRKSSGSPAVQGAGSNGGGPSSAAELIARAEWPSGLSRGLLLFVPAPPGGATRYHVLVIPERAANARPASARIFNYSTVPVAVQLGTQEPTQLAPRGVFDSELHPAGGMAPFRLAEKEEQGWRVVVNRNLALPADRPLYVFVRNAVPNPLEPKNPIIDYRLIYERPVAPPPVATK